MKYKPGDIIIGEFPYTDQENFKLRAFLVVAVAKPFIWGLMMSKIDSMEFDDGYAYQINASEVNFTLRETTGIRMNVLQTIHPKVCKKILGNVNSECLERVMDSIKNTFKF